MNRSYLLRRTLCAVCALTLALALASPAALAAGDASTDNTQATLSRADAAQMAQADAAVEALVNSSAYDAMDLQQRQDLINAVFDALESTGAKTLTDLTEQRVRNALTAARDLLSDETERALFTESMELLARAYISSARKSLPVIRQFGRKK